MSKLAAKYKPSVMYYGRVGELQLRAEGRTKREAVKRLRKEFAKSGVSTRPDSFVDLLEVAGSGSGFCRP